MKKAGKENYVLILHNTRSAHNVGAIFRTAEAIGIDKVYLTGFTPAPADRFGRPCKDIAKTALGAEQMISWESVPTVNSLLKKLKKSGIKLVAVEQGKRATDYKKVLPKKPAAFIFGNEVTGLPTRILKLCDVVASIPMRGKKESLNVSVAAGIALYRMLDR